MMLRLKNGFSAIEIVVGVSIAALVIVFIMHAVVRFVTFSGEYTERVRAIYLAEEGLEGARFIRDDSWESLSGLSDGTHYLAFSGSAITVTTTPEIIEGKFSRAITLESVYRTSADSDIVASTSPVSKSIDPGTRFVTATVTWGSPTTSISMSTYLTDMHE